MLSASITDSVVEALSSEHRRNPMNVCPYKNENRTCRVRLHESGGEDQVHCAIVDYVTCTSYTNARATGMVCPFWIDLTGHCSFKISSNYTNVACQGMQYRFSECRSFTDQGVPEKMTNTQKELVNIYDLVNEGQRAVALDRLIKLRDALRYEEPPKDNSTFVKDSLTEEKLRWDLLPFDAIREAVKRFTYGAKHYSPDNWKKCEDTNIYWAALLRHIDAVRSGELIDDDTGEDKLTHMSAILWNALCLTWFELHKNDNAT